MPRFLRPHWFIFLTFFGIAFAGTFLTLPPGPLCDEGMVLFMEGGCDWGESNLFFYSKVGLLVAANVAAATCCRARVRRWRGFIPHFVALAILAVVFRSGGRCDTYYGHPNGSLGQMMTEIAAFSALGLALVVRVAEASRAVQVAGLIAWNGIHIGAFYMLLSVVPHYTWSHTVALCAVMMALAVMLHAGRRRKTGG